MSTVRPSGASPLLVDHDLLFDLRHLDDPEPPRFGALRAEEATQRAAQHRARRARLAAGAVLAVALVLGIGATAIGTSRVADPVVTAQAPSTSLPLQLGPDVTDAVPPSLAPVPADPAPAPPEAPVATTAVPPPVTTTAAPATTLPASGPALTLPPSAATGTTMPSRGTSQPPTGSVPAPSGLRLTLSPTSTQLVAGTSVRAVVRFENRRSTSVTLAGGGCSSMWRADLYKDGSYAPEAPMICMMAISQVVGPGQTVVEEVELRAHPDLPAGTYGAFTTIHLGENNGPLLHSEAVDVTVTRP